MKKHIPYYISVIVALTFATTAIAGDAEIHNVYKVTTYNLGTLLGDQGAPKLSLQNYEPLMITSTKADILNANPNKTNFLKGTSSENSTKGFAIAAEYSATQHFALQGVLGVTQNMQTNSALDTNSSWEANLGVIYRFLDNLSYEVHFGYMEAGDIFKERNSYSDEESIIMISNKLTMSF